LKKREWAEGAELRVLRAWSLEGRKTSEVRYEASEAKDPKKNKNPES